MIDTDSGTVIATIPVALHPAGVAVTPDGSRAYITSPDAQELTRIDGQSLTVTGQLKLGDGPLAIALSPDDGTLYVADWYRNVVHVVDSAALAGNGADCRGPCTCRPGGLA